MTQTLEPSAPESQPKRKPHSGDFKPGNTAWKKTEKKVFTSDSQPMVEAMEHVASKPATEDVTLQQNELRKWLRKNQQAFFTKLADLQKSEASLKAAAEMAAKREAVQVAGEAGPDGGVEKVEELIRVLLAEWRGK